MHNRLKVPKPFYSCMTSRTFCPRSLTRDLVVKDYLLDDMLIEQLRSYERIEGQPVTIKE